MDMCLLQVFDHWTFSTTHVLTSHTQVHSEADYKCVDHLNEWIDDWAMQNH